MRIPNILKKVLLLAASLVGLLVGLLVYSYYADQRNFRAAVNPCERACVQDSGGIEDCRKQCVSHPTTYGPAGVPTH